MDKGTNNKTTIDKGELKCLSVCRYKIRNFLKDDAGSRGHLEKSLMSMTIRE